MTRTAEALQSDWSRLLLRTLVRAGVRDAVISPGSRSTPFTWAALHTPELSCHSVIDERSAGFFALGLARISARPTLLLCTSGSAAANYFPAVVEASLARLPLVILTADRPFDLADASAAQTMDQLKLYGDFVRRSYELGLADSEPTALRGLVRLVTQGVSLAMGPEPGPVHLNARARKPLEPAPSAVDVAQDQDVRAATIERPSPSLEARDLERLAAACESAQSGLIICGPLPPNLPQPELSEAFAALAAATEFPVLCEATSQLRFGKVQIPEQYLIDGFEPLLAEPDLRRHLAPEIVLRFGPPATSSGVEALLASGVRYHVVAEHGFPDPAARAASVLLAPIVLAAKTLARARASAKPAGGQPDSAAAERARKRLAFAKRWRRATQIAWEGVTAVLRSETGLREGTLVETALRAMPDQALLVLGNSLPIRDVDQYAPSAARGLRVVHQRGANGIDGLVSGAAGSAQAIGGPGLALIGDVSVAHDLSGLGLLARLRQPFVLLMLDNAGGRIFDQLPIAEHYASDPAVSRFWLTAPELDFEHAARAAGLVYERVESAEQLERALLAAFERDRPSFVHGRVDSDSAATDRVRISQRLKLELGELLASES